MAVRVLIVLLSLSLLSLELKWLSLSSFGAVHGYVLTAWAAAGLAGPQIAAYVRTVTGSYEMTLYIFAAVFVLALIVSMLMKRYVNKARAEREVTGNTAHA